MNIKKESNQMLILFNNFINRFVFFFRFDLNVNKLSFIVYSHCLILWADFVDWVNIITERYFTNCNVLDAHLRFSRTYFIEDCFNELSVPDSISTEVWRFFAAKDALLSLNLVWDFSNQERRSYTSSQARPTQKCFTKTFSRRIIG